MLACRSKALASVLQVQRHGIALERAMCGTGKIRAGFNRQQASDALHVNLPFEGQRILCAACAHPA